MIGNKHTQENPRINRQDKQKIAFYTCLPQGDLPTVH